jgi:hypothetical protein
MSQTPERPSPSAKEKPAPVAPQSAPPKPKLDLENLDLTVEEIEHRITPGETNVFDK